MPDNTPPKVERLGEDRLLRLTPQAVSQLEDALETDGPGGGATTRGPAPKNPHYRVRCLSTTNAQSLIAPSRYM